MILGGWRVSDDTVLDDVISYNAQTNKWTTAKRLAHAARSAACVTYGALIYLFGGRDKDKKNVGHFQLYNPDESCTGLSQSMRRASRAQT